MATVDHMFLQVVCKNTFDGHLLQWKQSDGFEIEFCRVYGTQEGKQWIIVADHIEDDFVLLPPNVAALTNLYRLEGYSRTGDTCIVDNIQPQITDKQAMLIARELRNRENTLMRAHPYGGAVARIYMRKRTGRQCQTCDPECPTSGDNPLCPECLGTGITGGYYLYPQTLRLLLIDARDDKQAGTEANQVMAVTQVFRTVFGGVIREYDILQIGTELYDINRQTVVSSVAEMPVAYMLQTVQMLKSEPRYKMFKDKFGL